MGGERGRSNLGGDLVMDDSLFKKLAGWKGVRVKREEKSAPPSPASAAPPPAPPPPPRLPEFADVPRRAVQGAERLELLHRTEASAVADDRIFSVGLDAGTSGIRVAVHNEFHGATTLFDFGPNLAGGTRFSMPAVAAVR